uniref:Secreted protein n=1 Tax=Panagrellus redivivus TaxID=6233 RepID=A0A7E4VDU1_PANRE
MIKSRSGRRTHVPIVWSAWAAQMMMTSLCLSAYSNMDDTGFDAGFSETTIGVIAEPRRVTHVGKQFHHEKSERQSNLVVQCFQPPLRTSPVPSNLSTFSCSVEDVNMHKPTTTTTSENAGVSRNVI